MKNIEVVFFDAGGGHRSAAIALRDAMRLENRPWRVELVNLQHVLERYDPVRMTTGVYSQEIYNWSLRRGWTRAASHALPAVHGIIRLLHPAFVKELREFWIARRPDLVVSVIPHYNRALFESLSSVLPATAFLTVMTDLADHPPHFWLERQNQHFVCGSDRAIDQGLGLGIPREKLWRVSGMPVHPRFYESFNMDRAEARAQLGLDPYTPTGLVLFGGYGSALMTQILERMSEVTVPVQLIFLCGRNAHLASNLQAAKSKTRRVVKTFTEDVAGYMRLSDFFIGKPGPGCVSEALVMGLPVIVERNARTMVQERYTCEWLAQQGAGIVIDSFARIGEAVTRLLEAEVYAAFGASIAGLNNHAVFEITSIIEQMLDVSDVPVPPPVLSLPNGAGARSSFARPLDTSLGPDRRRH